MIAGENAAPAARTAVVATKPAATAVERRDTREGMTFTAGLGDLHRGEIPYLPGIFADRTVA